MAGFFHWLRRRHGQGADNLRDPRRDAPLRWVVVESVASPALGSMFVQVLQRAGVPVLIKQWGAGAGAMGGALTGVRLLVPEDRLGEARDVLGVGRAGSEADHD